MTGGTDAQPNSFGPSDVHRFSITVCVTEPSVHKPRLRLCGGPAYGRPTGYPPMPPFDFKQLHRLDRSSSDFPSLLTNIFREKEYRDCVANLQDDDSAWFIGYLDNVSPSFTSIVTAQVRCRPSTFSRQQAQRSGRVYENSGRYVAVVKQYRNRAYSPAPPLSLQGGRLPLGVTATSTKDPTPVQKSVSNAYGFTRTTEKELPRTYVIKPTTPSLLRFR